MKDARIDKELLHRARHLILIGASPQDVLSELTDFGLQASEASQIVNAAESFVLTRNLCVGYICVVLGILFALWLCVSWAHDSSQITFLKGFMGVILMVLGIKFLFARRSGVA
nr:putative integron gene cassette protein [uncultured bacterium]